MSEDLATDACKEFVESEIFQQDGGSVSAHSILTALDLCLKNSFFCFNDKVYKQISGVGTGVKLAPTYACLGLGKFEKLVSLRIKLCCKRLFYGSVLSTMFLCCSEVQKLSVGLW